MSGSVEQRKKRLIEIDALRGCLIVLVIIGHALQQGEGYERNVAWNVIYSFHMAAFFVVSGYVSASLKAISIWRRCKQLFVPFVVWTLLVSLRKEESGAYLLEVIRRPDSSYWFLYCLFMVSLAFHGVAKIVSDKYKELAWGVCGVGLIVIMLFGLMVKYET